MSTPPFALHAEETLEDLMSRMESVDALEDCDLDMIDGVFELEFGIRNFWAEMRDLLRSTPTARRSPV